MAVVAVTIMSGCLTGIITWSERRSVDIVHVRRISLTSLCGMPLGLIALTVASDRQLSIAIGCLVLLIAGALFTLPLSSPSRAVVSVAGVLSGSMLTATGMNGPPVVAVFQAVKMSKETFRASLQATFFCQDVVAIAGFVIVGRVGSPVLVASAGGFAGLVGGWVIGTWIFKRVAGWIFRYLVVGVILASGLMALIPAIVNK